MFNSIKKSGFLYDCSIEEGIQKDHDETNYFWPYTLDNGIPGDKILSVLDNRKNIGKVSDLWELPVYQFVVPPDNLCEKYGVNSGFKDSLKEKVSYFNTESGKISGLDWRPFCLCV